VSHYLYARRGGPSSYYDWRRGAPGGFRAAETRQLGGLGALDVFRSGAPEVLTGAGDFAREHPISTVALLILAYKALKR
jgi:hypothetical protein